MKKRLVFCFDGTWNRLDAPFPTNVVITAESVTPLADDVAQLIFYDEGVGTGEREKIRGGMFGTGLVTLATATASSFSITRRAMKSTYSDFPEERTPRDRSPVS
jgi:uncharacterized protein (DUF2235 family)